MVANSLCRDSVLWRGLYLAGGGTERGVAYGSFSADESGICVFCIGRMGAARTEIVNERNVRLRIGICWDFTGTDAKGKDFVKNESAAKRATSHFQHSVYGNHPNTGYGNRWWLIL